MSARNVPLGAMFRWVLDAFRMLFRRPATMFGAGAIMIGMVIVMMLPYIAVIGPLMFKASKDPAALMAQGMTPILSAYALMLVLSLLLTPPLVMGWMRLLRKLDLGQDASAFELLVGYRDRPSWMRGIGFALLAALVGLLLLGVFAAAFWGPLTAFIAQASANQAAMAAGLPPVPPQFPGALVLGYFVFLFTIMFLQLAFFVGFAELALRTGATVTGALGNALAGVGRNLHKLLLWAIGLMIAGLVVMVLVGIVLGLLFAALMMVSPVLGAIIGLLLYIPMLLLMYPLMHAGAYVAWKDLLGAAPPALAEPLAA